MKHIYIYTRIYTHMCAVESVSSTLLQVSGIFNPVMRNQNKDIVYRSFKQKWLSVNL